MGSWGTYPKDCDGALDLQYIIGDAINRELEQITAECSGYAYAGLIMLMLQKGFFIKRKFIEKAVVYMNEALDMAKNDKSDWKNNKKAIADISYVTQEFERLLNEEEKDFSILIKNKKTRKEALEREREILAPYNWLMRKEERNKKSWSGIFDLP